MKIGAIIVLYNNEKQIDKSFLKEELPGQIELCIVNNGSTDRTLELLKIIKEELKSNISILDIKKNTTRISAIRAGARFLFNNESFRHIGYIDASDIDGCRELNGLLEELGAYKKSIMEYNEEEREKQKIKKTRFQNIFSIPEILNKLKIS
jgi:glycosyltransferase involved in cell wall biosynthesis